MGLAPSRISMSPHLALPMNGRDPRGGPDPMGLRHITQRRDFKAAAANGRRFRTSAFTAQMLAREQVAASEGLRLGLTASRHTGTATERNRIRRRLRAAADLAGAPLGEATLDLVLVARREALQTPFATLQADIARALSKALGPGRKGSADATA
jgi:ribonuclease P protein component